MKSKYLHLWVLVNLSVCVFVYLKPSLLPPLTLVVFASNLLLKDKGQLKDELHTPLGKIEIALGIAFVAFMVFMAFSGTFRAINQSTSEDDIRLWAMIIGGIITVGYLAILKLNRKEN